MATANLIAPLERFLEASQVIRRDRLVARRRKGLQTAVAATFEKQGRLFLRSLSQLRGRFDDNAIRESVSPSDWLPYWNAVDRDTRIDMRNPLQVAILNMLVMGGGDLMAGLGITPDELGRFGISWNLENPRAVLYAQQHAAAQVTKINDTTRSYINSMVSQAVTEGHSYDRLSQTISDRFTEFATGGDNPRSRRVAVFELGDAYEAGNEVAAQELVGAGLKIQKKWLTAGDDRVRPSHKDNQVEGWIAFDDSFPSGDNRPPTDPGCRCTTLHRRAK